MTTPQGALAPGKHHALVEGGVEIAVSLPIFWAAFADLRQWPRWVPGLEEAQWMDQPEWGLGSHFYLIQHLGFPLGRAVATFTLTAVRPEHALQYAGPIERLQLVAWWDFGETPAGTHVTVRQLYHGGWLRLYRWLLFERRMRGLLAGTLAGLKAYVERGAPGGQP